MKCRDRFKELLDIRLNSITNTAHHITNPTLNVRKSHTSLEITTSYPEGLKYPALYVISQNNIDTIPHPKLVNLSNLCSARGAAQWRTSHNTPSLKIS